MNRPFDAVREAIFEVVNRNKEDTNESLSKTDTPIVWIVGFSIGGISLIVADFKEIKESFEYLLLKTNIVLLPTSLLTGVVFRI